MKTILVTNWKGGSGKTTLAQNLLVSAATSGFTVAGFDTDPQVQLAEWWEARPDGVVPVTMYAQKLPEVVGLPIMDEPCDVLVIDTPPGVEAYPEAYKRVIAAADLIIIPCQPTRNDRASAKKTLDFLAATGKPVITVLNRVKPRTTDIAKTRRELAGIGADVCPVDIPDLTEVHRAGERGLGVAEIVGLKSSDDFNAIWAYARSRMGMTP